MLTPKDLSLIKNIIDESIETKTKRIVNEAIETKTRKIVDESIKEAFEDFYDNIFEPHVTESAQQHQEIVKEIKGLKKEVTGLKEETEEIKEFIRDHDKRIDKLEMITGVR